MTVHDFKTSLARSHEMEDAPWWEPVYRRAFPAFHSMMSVRRDGWAQRGGIDRVVTLKSGKTLTIDEKVRDSDWPDILLERWSDVGRKTPGWIQKDLACDFIAYAFIPSQQCYLLPFLTLRKAWIDNGREWVSFAEQRKNGFAIIDAKNRGYITQSVAVPKSELLKSLTDSMAVSWVGEVAA